MCWLLVLVAGWAAVRPDGAIHTTANQRAAARAITYRTIKYCFSAFSRDTVRYGMSTALVDGAVWSGLVEDNFKAIDCFSERNSLLLRALCTDVALMGTDGLVEDNNFKAIDCFSERNSTLLRHALNGG